ncbi:MAG: polysaccharide deacetylase [Deltaproteobacteria bacterium]|nr:polysaccharide deacetylase [Deltaproteobacteria bacterium]
MVPFRPSLNRLLKKSICFVVRPALLVRVPRAVIAAIVIASVLRCAPLEANGLIFNYRPVFKPYYDAAGAVKIAVREFERNGASRALIVDADSFQTGEIDASTIAFNREVEKEVWRKTPFASALYRYTAGQDGLIHNDGIIRAEGAAPGVFLTVDLCPSKRNFDRNLFTSTIGLPLKDKPIAIAVSGLWIERHRDEFNWIAGEARSNRLSVTWVNHSYSHPYRKGIPDEKNFLLSKGVDFDKEALGLEVLLLENGLLPSPFFRFPGLVSDRRALERLRALSLIPVGADAWLAKGRMPGPGSIILVHGNGNEKRGVKKLINFYKEKKGDFKEGRLTLKPLQDAFAR